MVFAMLARVGWCVFGFFGGYGKRGTPGLIPNPVVKALSADGTAPGRCVGE